MLKPTRARGAQQAIEGRGRGGVTAADSSNGVVPDPPTAYCGRLVTAAKQAPAGGISALWGLSET